jgi:hypothetical protein
MPSSHPIAEPYQPRSPFSTGLRGTELPDKWLMTEARLCTTLDIDQAPKGRQHLAFGLDFFPLRVGQPQEFKAIHAPCLRRTTARNVSANTGFSSTNSPIPLRTHGFRLFWLNQLRVRQKYLNHTHRSHLIRSHSHTNPCTNCAFRSQFACLPAHRAA